MSPPSLRIGNRSFVAVHWRWVLLPLYGPHMPQHGPDCWSPQIVFYIKQTADAKSNKTALFCYFCGTKVCCNSHDLSFTDCKRARITLLLIRRLHRHSEDTAYDNMLWNLPQVSEIFHRESAQLWLEPKMNWPPYFIQKKVNLGWVRFIYLLQYGLMVTENWDKMQKEKKTLTAQLTLSCHNWVIHGNVKRFQDFKDSKFTP